MMTKLLPIPLVLALLAGPSRALAADAASDAAAEALFAEAKALDNAGDTRGALVKLLEAQRVSPSIGTLLNVGDCYERLGQLASAWGAFRSAEIMARTAGDAAREAEAGRRADVLAPRLSKLAINVPPAARVAGFELRRDGTVIGEGQWGSALPVDAGQHTIEARAPGRQKWTTTVKVAAGGASVAVSVPELSHDTAEAEKAPDVPAWGGQRIAGVAIGGAGVVGLVVSGIFTARMVSKNNESKMHCLPSNPDLCSAEGVALRDQALDAARIATPTFIASALTATTGLVVFLTAPRRAAPKAPATSAWRAQPVLGPGLAGLQVQGVW